MLTCEKKGTGVAESLQVSAVLAWRVPHCKPLVILHGTRSQE